MLYCIIWYYMILYDIIYLDLRKDTNNCPFARFLPLGRISCEGAGNGHFDYCGQFWISCLLGWSYSTLRKNVSIFLGGNPREKGGNTREKGGNTRADSSWLKRKWKHEVASFFLKWSFLFWNGQIYKKWTEIKPKSALSGKKFVTNEYPGIDTFYTAHKY